MFNADTPVPALRAKYVTYGAIFHALLVAAARRTAPSVTVASQNFDMVQQEYPDDILEFDAIIISGSGSSSYDDRSWIKTLDDYIWRVYRDCPQVKLFGGCFGHQIICQSLLRPFGVVVEKDPNGWEIGVHEVVIHEEFRKAFDSGTETMSQGRASPISSPTEPGQTTPSIILNRPPPSRLRFQFIHADSVMLPPSGFPKGWTGFGKSAKCSVQGAYQPRRVLTYQGHFEFDRLINTETVKAFRDKWDPQDVQKFLEDIDTDDDSLEAAEILLKFLLEQPSLKSVQCKM
ncbi:hypothetical protein CDV31_009028 [Fusarium ambrosium]|uniref:Glutamine amidotransferase domain-containing protein n=1 Tax=Fusarium ambrosium TaxID=131363 RepID=A0A428TX49_9HYPO|nr:hypothetical protein CDV31_009028 [Fusarium ambrosium]